jgi:hypothetical protein
MGRVTKRGIGSEPVEEIKLGDEDILAIREAAVTWADEQYMLGNTQLSREALRFIYVMCHPLSGKNVREWANVADVDFKSFYRNKDKPAWHDAVEKLRSTYRNRQLSAADRINERLLDSDDPKVQLAAARTIYEREGQFIQRVETTRVVESAEERAFKRAMAKKLNNGEASENKTLN